MCGNAEHRHTVDEVISDINENESEENNVEDKKLFGVFFDWVGGAAKDASESAKEVLNRFIDAIALFVITNCMIPIIVVFVVIWFIKFLFEIPVPYPNVRLLPKLHKENKVDEEAEV